VERTFPIYDHGESQVSDQEFSIAEFTAHLQSVASKVDAALQVSQAGTDLCLVTHPGSGSQVWVKAVQDGEKFAVLKTRTDAPKPAHMDGINAIGEGFLKEILTNYVKSVGHPGQ
jgi:hypothetical protein